MIQTKTELHTHLAGMASFDGLIRLMKYFRYPGFPVNEDGELDFKCYVRRKTEITPEIIKALMIPETESVDYSMLDPIYRKRSALLADIAECCPKEKTELDEWLNKVYALYFNLALSELIEQGVEYVEISFSNVSKITYMLENVHPGIASKIDFRFLLATNRNRAVNQLKSDKKDLKRGLDSDLAIGGFDFMGLETNMNQNENDSKNKPSNSINSFRTKLDMVIDILKDFPKSTLRIHAGENKESKNNPLSTLRMIDCIAKDRGIIIPPPEVRLGHAIYFEDCEEYLHLLKKYKVIVEINATSNKKLRNIKDFKEINYEYYVNNEVPVVVSTDGAGMYDTSIVTEDHIAVKYGGIDAYKKIFNFDKKIVDKKRGN